MTRSPFVSVSRQASFCMHMVPQSSGEQRPMRLEPLSARIHPTLACSNSPPAARKRRRSNHDETARQTTTPTRTRPHRTLNIKQSPASTALITPHLTDFPTPYHSHCAQHTLKTQKPPLAWRQRQFLPGRAPPPSFPSPFIQLACILQLTS